MLVKTPMNKFITFSLYDLLRIHPKISLHGLYIYRTILFVDQKSRYLLNSVIKAIDYIIKRIKNLN